MPVSRHFSIYFPFNKFYTRDAGIQLFMSGIAGHVQTSAYEHFNDAHLHMVDMQIAQLRILNAVAQWYNGAKKCLVDDSCITNCLTSAICFNKVSSTSVLISRISKLATLQTAVIGELISHIIALTQSHRMVTYV